MRKIEQQLADKPVKRALGRGLAALIPSSVRVEVGESMEESTQDLKQIALERISLNPFQPRVVFAAEQLEELASSIRQHGVIQPIVVRPLEENFELVAGERRFRAATQAGLSVIPAVVRNIDDRSSLALALIENLQRESLNPVEAARAYKRLLSDFSLTQSELAADLGKSQSAVANALRLLNLPDEILESVSSAEISEGHAKVLLSVADDALRQKVWQEVISEGLSVRETERRIVATGNIIPRGIREVIRIAGVGSDTHTKKVEEDLRLALGTAVKLKFSNKERGKIELSFYDRDQLDGLIERLVKS